MSSSDPKLTSTPTTPKSPKSPVSAAKRPNATSRSKHEATKVGTPKSAPAKGTSRHKKPEATLLGDFLLGRPSPSRLQRRKSLDLVKAEMKAATVNKIQLPGGVKDRVTHWQKASAAGVNVPGSPKLPVSEQSKKTESKTTGSPTAKAPVQTRKGQGIAVPKSLDEERKKITSAKDVPKSNDAAPSSPAPNGIATPKKRVISDSHWKTQKGKTPPKRKSPVLATSRNTLPRNFVAKHQSTPPLSHKINRWAEQVEPSVPVSRHSSVSTGQSPPEDRPKPQRRKPSITTFGSDDGIRIHPSNVGFPNGGISHVERRGGLSEGMRTDLSKNPRGNQHFKVESEEDSRIDGNHRFAGRHQRSVSDGTALRRKTALKEAGNDSSAGDEIKTPLHKQNHQSRARNSLSPSNPERLKEVPVGYSAFSVLDMPLGADAHTMRKNTSKPNRNSSYRGMPNVFKKVKEMVQDAADPPRVGINQPPSIESWLKGTSDPFLDDSTCDLPRIRPKTSGGQDSRPVPRSEFNKRRLSDEHHHSLDNSAKLDHGIGEENKPPAAKEDSPLMRARAVFEKTPPPIFPTGLKRSPAIKSPRSPSSPTFPRRLPLRERIAEAFRGESVFVGDSMFASLKENKVNKGSPNNTEDDDLILQFSDLHHDSPHNTMHDTRRRKLFNEKARQESQGASGESDNSRRDRKEIPSARQRHLSTIASVDTLEAQTSVTETPTEYSVLSDTTVTQNTSHTGHTSNTSHESHPAPGIIRRRSNRAPIQVDGERLSRRLTKHSDLMSLLSLPDTGNGGSRSLRSARSVRTVRKNLKDASIDDLLQELSADEAKYSRELKTLVDGVIPVLLTSVLSKSQPAIRTGLLHDHPNTETGSAVTKPIVVMGIVLERLRSLHKRIPLEDPQQLVSWAFRAHNIYADYLMAWRMGFKDVIINLAPATRSNSVEEQNSMDKLLQHSASAPNTNDGDRVDVAFLLKRPLVRIKHLAKFAKGVSMRLATEETRKLKEAFDDLLLKTRRRVKEEEARQEDLAANNIDASRARDLRTLAPMEGVVLDRSRQVNMKDFFSFNLLHSSGQQMDCRIEMIYRDEQDQRANAGDILICETDMSNRWLLLPPLDMKHISARRGERETELVIMVCGVNGTHSWHELIFLTADNEETVLDWIDILGTDPIPPLLINADQDVFIGQEPSVVTFVQGSECDRGHATDVEVPIGEKRRDHDPGSDHTHAVGQDYEDHIYNDPTQKDSHYHTHTMSGGLGNVQSVQKHHGKHQSIPANAQKVSSRLPSYEGSEWGPAEEDTVVYDTPTQHRTPSMVPSTNLPYIPKTRQSSTPPTFEEIIDQPTTVRASRSPGKKARPIEVSKSPKGDEDAPVPPDHRSPRTPTSLKKTPILQSLAAKFLNRRSSSPLKHEYQPSVGSSTSDSVSESGDSEDYTETSDSEEELEELEALPPAKKSPTASIYSLPNVSLAPSNSASQEPYRQAPVEENYPKVRFIASVSAWSNKGVWNSLHSEDCSVFIGAGVIEAYVIGQHSKESDQVSGQSNSKSHDAEPPRPLVALDLTPLVPLRKSTVVDIEIRSPPLARSQLSWPSSLRFRTHTTEDCNKLYAAIHRARLDNPIFKRLEQERLVNSYGGQTFHEVQGSKQHTSFFGRRRSYRATTRAPSTEASDDKQSTNSFTSAILNRLSSGDGFNIAKSTIIPPYGRGGVSSSPATSLYTDSASGSTPPITPICGSVAEGSLHQSPGCVKNINIRCYKLVTHSGWGLDISAHLTIENAPRVRHLSSGLEKRVVVTAKVPKGKENKGTPAGDETPRPPTSGTNTRTPSRRSSLTRRQSFTRDRQDAGVDEEKQKYVVLDTVIAGNNVLRYGRTGIAINVWEDVVDADGRVGAIGGSSGITRKWMFQFASQEEMRWIYAILGGR